jgi:hypothetical protein
MTSAWNVEKNVERSGRINRLQLLSKNVTADFNSTVLRLVLVPTQPSVDWVSVGGRGNFSGIISTKECYLQTFIRVMVDFLVLCFHSFVSVL